MNRSICFVGSDVYPVLNRHFGSGYIGGESVQVTLLAKAFNDLGWRVSVVDWDYGQPEGEVIDGIRIHKTFKQNAGIPIIRFIHPRLTSIVKALRKANAQIYYQSCAGMMTGVVAWFCRHYNKTFVFRTAHDTDCIPGEHLIKLWRDKKIYEYGLRRADLIAVQGVNQANLLDKHYGLKGFVVTMAVELPLDQELQATRGIDGLWVNNMRPFKRPERFIELAKSLSKHRFVMIGGSSPGFEKYFEKITSLAKPVKNLEFIGPVPYHEVNAYFLDAKVFINTSESEGFPNSFLQAWARKTPVISFFDPDGIIAKEGIGISPVSHLEMIDAVEKLLENSDLRNNIGEKAKMYVMNSYSPELVAKCYIRLINRKEL
ncbi:MAG TPA: glycosyl transferase family 1 [Bacteroidales bacterium]|nr:glycosyl transferase family 1 [Bacteroidales bacterium]